MSTVAVAAGEVDTTMLKAATTRKDKFCSHMVLRPRGQRHARENGFPSLFRTNASL